MPLHLRGELLEHSGDRRPRAALFQLADRHHRMQRVARVSRCLGAEEQTHDLSELLFRTLEFGWRARATRHGAQRSAQLIGLDVAALENGGELLIAFGVAGAAIFVDAANELVALLALGGPTRLLVDRPNMRTILHLAVVQ